MKFVSSLAGLVGLVLLAGCSSTHQQAGGAAGAGTSYGTGTAGTTYSSDMGGMPIETTTIFTAGPYSTTVYPGTPVTPVAPATPAYSAETSYEGRPVYTEPVSPQRNWPDYRLNSAYRGYENHSDDWAYKYRAP
ncbi:hypothetical protein [Pedosphaera parvula]|uniref:Lipoprotein n=1 Tax=Pedosphaera parvula (strain Ellin514) TaxID=320771 RepID=B9XED2_PEDPL|nr:hypothetical protein [Pedosphaera parvula]EEF61646.1 hypothetical protein Cflav_PD4686 [Pedosphaera parvula Ellin514]